jgi:16S rRNA (guanine527-N7)-methyltransferase
MESEASVSAGLILNRLLAEAGLAPLDGELTCRFEAYLSLFIRWNSRTNLSAIREPDAIMSRHFVESIACAHALPAGLSTLLDFGSGGGLPGIPIALCRPEINVTLAESQGKKAAFLQEVVRRLGVSAKVFSGRAETLVEKFNCVTLRAVDKMEDAVRSSAELVQAGNGADGWLALMTTRADAVNLQGAAGGAYEWMEAQNLPGSEDRILMLGRRVAN